MDAMVLALGIVTTVLGTYMTLWPEKAARGRNTGFAENPEPTQRYVTVTRVSGITLLVIGVPAVIAGLH